ncbi:MOSC domain-containing protein [Gryllotalpicola reticulitermitis]|uniref:MOSC domain-containing protein n=1 Tax=Gryllotalpicola reticulitermitis TaxID=1184153 RepID=A0ABV8Q8X4_9MICO
MATLLALCRVDKLMPDSGSVGVTAIDKQPVADSLEVKAYGVYGDVQADRKNHGGLFQAVYAYAQEDADWWAGELGREIPAGLFGENLRTIGLPVSDAEIGERWLIGGALLLEVTSPRTPCATFQRRMGEEQWIKRFTEAGRVGAYFRVIRHGAIAAGDEIEVIHRPAHGVSVRRMFEARGAAKAELAAALAEHQPAETLHPEIQKLLA